MDVILFWCDAKYTVIYIVLNVWIVSYAYVFFVVNYACAFRRFEHFNSIYEIVMKNLEISTSHRDFFALFAIKGKQSTTISEHRNFFGCFSFIISLQREWNWIHFAWWMSTHSLCNISSWLFFSFPSLMLGFVRQQHTSNKGIRLKLRISHWNYLKIDESNVETL